MQIRRYIELKSKGLTISVEQKGQKCIAVKRFDVEDGSEANPEIQDFTVQNLDDMIAAKHKEIANLEEMKADLESLQEKKV